jgi:hypothetical protein
VIADERVEAEQSEVTAESRSEAYRGWKDNAIAEAVKSECLFAIDSD